MSSLTIHGRDDPAGGMPYRDASYYPEPIAASDGFGISDLMQVIRRNRLLILMIMIPATLVTLAWQLTSPTLYLLDLTLLNQQLADVSLGW